MQRGFVLDKPTDEAIAAFVSVLGCILGDEMGELGVPLCAGLNELLLWLQTTAFSRFLQHSKVF